MVMNIIVLLAIWFIIGLGIEAGLTDIFEEVIFPNTIYENSSFNWFGCWFLFILLSIFSPIGFIFKLVGIICYLIYTFVKFIFTVGRDD